LRLGAGTKERKKKDTRPSAKASLMRAKWLLVDDTSAHTHDGWQQGRAVGLDWMDSWRSNSMTFGSISLNMWRRRFSRNMAALFFLLSQSRPPKL